MSYLRKNFYAVTLFLSGLAFLLFCLPFFAAIVFAAIIAFSLKPLQNRILIKKYHLNKTISVYIIMSFLILLLVPFIFSFLSFFSAGKDLAKNFETDTSVEIFDNAISNMYENFPSLNRAAKQSTIKSYAAKGAKRLVEPTLAIASEFFIGLPMFFLNLFIFSASLFYFIADSNKIYSFTKGLEFIDSPELDKIIKITQRSCQSTIFAAFITGIVQSAILTITAMVIGIDYVFTVFFITFFVAQIPLIGTAPVSFGLFIFAYQTNQTSSIILVVIAAVIAGFSDNIVRAWILSKYDSIHPLVGLIAAIGGLLILGPVGVLLGPVVTLLFIKVLDIEYSDKTLIDVK